MRLDNKNNIMHAENITIEDIRKGNAKQIGESIYYRKKKIYNDTNKPNYCNPIISIYITALARNKLYQRLIDIENDVFYIDTDSIFTTRTLNNSTELGELKLEYTADEYYLIKPKFYALKINDKYKIKIKGCSKLDDKFDKFDKILREKKYTYNKFLKMREAMIRNMPFNYAMDVTKELSLEDTKRRWAHKFDVKDFQDSKPLII